MNETMIVQRTHIREITEPYGEGTRRFIVKVHECSTGTGSTVYAVEDPEDHTLKMMDAEQFERFTSEPTVPKTKLYP